MNTLVALAVFFVLLKTQPGTLNQREYFTGTPEPSKELLPDPIAEMKPSIDMVAPKMTGVGVGSRPLLGEPDGPAPRPQPTEPESYEAVNGGLFYAPYETNMALTGLDGTEQGTRKLFEPQRSFPATERTYAEPGHEDTRPPDFSAQHQFNFLDRSHDADQLRAANDIRPGLLPRSPVQDEEAPYTGIPKFP
jgi:hypothetical protein